MQSTTEPSVTSNLIYVAACPMDQTLNRSSGVLGTLRQFICRKCKSIYTFSPCAK